MDGGGGATAAGTPKAHNKSNLDAGTLVAKNNNKGGSKDTIRSVRAATLEAPGLYGGVLSVATDIGNFNTDGCPWGDSFSERSSFQQKKLVGLSFDPVTLICGNCTEPHGILQSTAGGDINSKIFVLSDQGFPSALCPEPGSDCVNIVREECGSLFSLVDLFAELTGGCRIPTGTVILISSLSHLADVGFQAYAEDLGKVSNKLRRIFRGGLMVFPGLIFPPGELKDPVVIRSIADLMTWSAVVARAVEGGGGCPGQLLSLGPETSC
jgi:hypothetical protein